MKALAATIGVYMAVFVGLPVLLGFTAHSAIRWAEFGWSLVQ